MPRWTASVRWVSSGPDFLLVNTFFCLIAAENFAVIGNIKCNVTLRWPPKFLSFAVRMILLRVGNHNFCFVNNSGTFLETIKIAIKGAKMRIIVNSKMLPKVWYVWICMLIWLKLLNGVRHFQGLILFTLQIVDSFSGGLRESQYSFIDSSSIPLLVNLRGKSVFTWHTCRELASLLCILELFQKFQRYFPSDYDNLFKLSALFSVVCLLMKIPDIQKAICSLALRF